LEADRRVEDAWFLWTLVQFFKENGLLNVKDFATASNDGGFISLPKAYREDMHASYQSGMQVSSKTSQVFPSSWCEHRMC